MSEEAVTPAPDAPAPDAAPAEPAVPAKTFTQEDMDRVVNKVRRNTADRTRRQVEAYYRGRDDGRAVSQPKEEPKSAEPKLEDYASREDYNSARADWTARKAVREEGEKRDKEAKEKQQKEADEKAAQDFESRVLKKYPDFNKKLSETSFNAELPQGVGAEIAGSSVGEDILHHLVSNPDEWERICSLKPSAALKEIGKLESRFETEKKPTEPKPSNAPAPIEPVAGKNSPATAEPSERDDMKTWIRKRQQHVHGARR